MLSAVLVSGCALIFVAAGEEALPAAQVEAAAVGTLGTTPYVSKEWHFTARFPRPPLEEHLESPTPAGPLVIKSFRGGAAKMGDTAFGVMVMTPPKKAAESFLKVEVARQLLESTTGTIIAGTHGRIVRQGPIRRDGVDGWEIIIEAGKGRGRYLAFPHQGHIYQVLAIGNPDRVSEIDAFVDSFRWT